MPVVIYIDADDTRHEIDVEAGYSLMEGAFNHQLKGMLAECGGAAACGTCHSCAPFVIPAQAGIQ